MQRLRERGAGCAGARAARVSSGPNSLFRDEGGRKRGRARRVEAVNARRGLAWMRFLLVPCVATQTFVRHLLLHAWGIAPTVPLDADVKVADQITVAHGFLGEHAEALAPAVAAVGDTSIREAHLPLDPAPTLPQRTGELVLLFRTAIGTMWSRRPADSYATCRTQRAGFRLIALRKRMTHADFVVLRLPAELVLAHLKPATRSRPGMVLRERGRQRSAFARARGGSRDAGRSDRLSSACAAYCGQWRLR